MKSPAGYVIYRGPSALGDGDIVVIACALERSRNSKTGHMVQTYILRADMHPVEAVKTGADDVICGGCKHRGVLGVGRSCYVTLAHGPSHVWRSLQRGVYPDADPAAVGLLLAGKAIRLGTYGDPAAAPIEVWQDLIRYAAAWTGYSHAWQKLGADWREMLMASADTLEEAWTAQDMGWRTFRVGVGAIYGEVRVLRLARKRPVPNAGPAWGWLARRARRLSLHRTGLAPAMRERGRLSDEGRRVLRFGR